MSCFSLPRRLLTALAPLALAGCAGLSSPPSPLLDYQPEAFNGSAYVRHFTATPARTCEAARRALLSQGYIISAARSDAISGSKRFQPDGEVHIEISFNVVCVPEGASGHLATAFVSALQDRYVLKMVPNNSSLGVGPFGSISVPLSASEDSLVKVGSQTIPAGPFYDRYFALMQRLLGDMR